MDDIARATGVSISTVSRALRRDPNVALATQDRIRAVASALDYHMNLNASRLRTGRTQTIAIAVPALNNWYFAELMAGAHAVLAENAYDTVVAVVAESGSLQRILRDANPSTGRLDGVIVVDMDIAPSVVRSLRAAGTIVTTTGRAHPHYSSVMIDDVAAARTATSHLIGLGHRKIAMIGGSGAGPSPFYVPERRRAGYALALEHADLEAHQDEASGDFALLGGYEAAVGLFENNATPPSALFCMSDQMAIGAVRALRDLGFGVPDDVSVIGVDDHELAESFGLTTVRQPVRSIGRNAASLLLDQLVDRDAPPKHRTIATELVVRGTTQRFVP